MRWDQMLAHIGLGLVSYIPLAVSALITLATPSAQAAAGGFWPAFFGFLMVSMTSYAWVFLPPALIISLRGLFGRSRIMVNLLTMVLAMCWLALNWVAVRFA